MMVFLVSVMFHVYAAGPPIPVPVLPTTVESTWPTVGSTTQALPGTDNVFELEFNKDLAAQPFQQGGSITLTVFGGSPVEVIALTTNGNPKVERLSARKISIKFAYDLQEDVKYVINVGSNAIKFADNAFFAGVLGNDWNFTVKDVTAPTLAEECDHTDNVNGKFAVPVTQNKIRVCFNEVLYVAVGADLFKDGNIAFYTAAKAGLHPNDEFGGDVIYSKPANILLYKNGQVVDGTTGFDAIEIYAKFQPTLYAAIGANNVWPADRDMYLRVAAGLFKDAAGNVFAGLNGSPYDPYELGVDQYWFSTRAQAEIASSARAVANTAALPGTTRTGLLWDNDDIVVKVNNGNLRVIGGAVIETESTTAVVKQFIKLSVDGVELNYTVKKIGISTGTNETEFLLEPGSLTSYQKKTLLVELLDNKIQDKGNLSVVAGDEWEFVIGDFTAPVVSVTAENILCTNFDLYGTSNKSGKIYYALMQKVTRPAGWPTLTNVTAAEILKGQAKRTVAGKDYYFHFNNVNDAGVDPTLEGPYGKSGSDVALTSPSTAPAVSPLWKVDSLNINPEEYTEFWHKVLAFTGSNHGDEYEVFYFAVDPDAQGPYVAPFTNSNPGRYGDVVMLNVKLTDCMEPELGWEYQGNNETSPNPLWDACGSADKIKKQGSVRLTFETGATVEPLFLEFAGETWSDVVKLAVSTDGGTNYTEVTKTVTPIMSGNNVVGLTLAPHNSYPSGGKVKATLISGAVGDAAGNTINEEIVCVIDVVNYDDPWIKTFTVATKPVKFENEFLVLKGNVAKKDGAITIEFNNPMYAPARDEVTAGVLRPINSTDPNSVVWVGNYIKVHEGLGYKMPAPDADINSPIPDPVINFEYAVTYSNGGVTKIVMTPQSNYKSETWYYVEIEQDLLDENRVALTTVDNNKFTDPHVIYPNTGTAPNITAYGNAENYFIKFRSEDTIAPELRFVFNKVDNISTPPTETYPYITLIEEDEVDCINLNGFEDNGIPIQVFITEWSTMGFDDTDYYIKEDPNGLRPYFTLKNALGESLNFDIQVVEIYKPDADVTGIPQDEVDFYRDAVWFGIMPHEALEAGHKYSVHFDPEFKAPGSPLDLDAVFVDDNGNKLVADIYVGFVACVPDEYNEPECIASEISVSNSTIDEEEYVTTTSLNPSFTIAFDYPVMHVAGSFSQPNTNFNHYVPVTYMTLTGGGHSWIVRSVAIVNQGQTVTGEVPQFTYSNDGKTVTIPYSSLFYTGSAPAPTALTLGTEYTLTLHADKFYLPNSPIFKNCENVFEFATVAADVTAPLAAYYSPDLTPNRNNNLDQAPNAIDPRNPGKLTISWNEDVTVQAGKLLQLWENGTTLRKTYTSQEGDFDAETNTWSVDIPADFLAFGAIYHVEVALGFVQDASGNPSAHISGNVTGNNTWTFSTGADVAPTIVAWSPWCLVEPGEMMTEAVDAENVKIHEISIKLSEKVNAVSGKTIFLQDSRGAYATYFTTAVTNLSTDDHITWTYKFNPALVVPMHDDYIIKVQEGAFVQTYGQPLATPNYATQNFLSCPIDGWNTVAPASFAFGDKYAPTATIWPVDDDVHIPFNAHGYIKFSESVIARDVDEPVEIENWAQLVVTQNNIKNWVKVRKYNADWTSFTEFTSDEYVVEFVNPARTHARITFHDPAAPAVNGFTFNLEDESNYAIVINTVANINGTEYALQDMQGNWLFADDDDEVSMESKFTTEDITPPTFEIEVIAQTGESVDIKFTADEPGTLYYVVRSASATAPTANMLFSEAWGDVKVVEIDETLEAVDTWLETSVYGNYDYVVYAVMMDDEEDLYIASKNFNNAWVTTDPIFVSNSDTNPANLAVGIRDIRPAPNKNMMVHSEEFCFCDNDAPVVAFKEWNGEINVPVDATFEIKFEESVAFDDLVNLITGKGTPHEVRIRYWNNNISFPIASLELNEDGDGFIITPDGNLPDETKFYIEIDRKVVMDVPGENCAVCDNDPNYFAGLIGRDHWWFQTTDATAPILTSVTPNNSCVLVTNNQVVLTFTEKNEMILNPEFTGAARSIYIYEQGETVAYEIVPVKPEYWTNPTSGTWKLTVPTARAYNSEKTYEIRWNKNLFVDNAIPTQHTYTTSLNVGADPVWHYVSFTTEDVLKPVANWTLMSRLFGNTDLLVYPLAEGSFDSNAGDAADNLCALGVAPAKVGFYVWFDETVAYNATLADNFFLNRTDVTPAGTVSFTVTSAVAGTGGFQIPSNFGMPNGQLIPEGTRYFYVVPSDLGSLGKYEFGIVNGQIKDVPTPNTCTQNTLAKTTLFNFCVWDETPPTVKLYDSKGVEVTNNKTCVEEGDYFTLKFSKPVVKTSAVTLLPNLGNPYPTFDNLYLSVQDLMANGGAIYEFKTGSNLVAIDKVEIVVPGVEYKIYPKEDLNSEGSYVFTLKANVLKDMVRIPDGNVLPATTINFKVADWIAPTIVALSPLHNGTGFNPMGVLTITFNEPVTLGTNARIIIRDNGVPGLIYSYPANSNKVSLSADKLTVSVTTDGLGKFTKYYVQIQPGFVLDADCKNLPYDGKIEQGTTNDTWVFTTGDSDGPQATLWPTPGLDCTPIDANLVLTFDENINLTNQGQLVIYKVQEGGSFHNPQWPNAWFGDVVKVIPFKTANDLQVRITGSDVPNGLTQNVVTVIPNITWEPKATYYVRIVGDGVNFDSEADVVEDMVGNSWVHPSSHSVLAALPGIHYNQWYFTFGNADAPVLAGMTPEWGATVEAGVASATTDLTMTFEEEVAFGNGKIKVFEFIVAPQGGVASQKANLWKEFSVPADVASGKISISADLKTVTVHEVALLDGINWYYVLVEPGAITNNIECTLTHWDGISDPDFWLFNTAPDVTDPELTANAVTSEACSETYLDPSTVAIELHFSEDVSVANGSGLVEIMEDGEVVASATITADHIEGNVVKLSIADFDNAIEDQKLYTIVIGGDAIHDKATASLTGTQGLIGLVPVGNGNWFEGVEIEFHTGDFTAPYATNWEPNMVIDLENDVTLKVWFSEPVQPGTGKLILTDAVSGEEWEFMAEDAEWSADKMMLSYEVNLPDETSYYVTLEEGFVMDMVYEDSCDEPRLSVAVEEEDAWTFEIDDNTIPAIVEDLTENTDNLTLTFDVVLKYNDILTAVDATKATLMLEGAPATATITAEIGTDPTTIVLTVTAPVDQTEYWLVLAEGFVLDDAINANASEEEVTGPYYVGDRTEPVLEGAGESGIVDMPKGFTEGFVKIWVDFFDDSELTVMKPITITDADGEVVATWTPELDEEQYAEFYPELGFGEYTVHIPAGAVVDTNGNEYEGFHWSLTITDSAAPCLVSISPADGETDVALDTPLVMEFCENVAAGNQLMKVKVYNILEISGDLGGNAPVYSTSVTADMIDGKFVTIVVPGLEYGTSYIVLVDAGAITDEFGNAFEGITDPTDWNFTTLPGYIAHTIAEIQGTGAESPVVDKKVIVTGTVTGVVPGAGYFVQDANAAWSGIWVSDAETFVLKGNGVQVKGEVKEINGVTTIVGTGTVINPPLAVVAIELGSPSEAKDEKYESVLVTVVGARAKEANEDGTWDVYTTEESVATIGKWMYAFTPVFDHYYTVTGVVNGANNLYKVEPRELADIVDLTTTNVTPVDAVDFKVYPNPFTNELTIDNNDKLTRVTITNIAGQRVLDVQYPERVIRTANLVSGVYVISLFNEDGIVKSERIVKR
jgi:hypothetical protein